MNRFDIFLLALSADGSKTRRCVIVSPDEMNRHLRTVIIAPISDKERECPTHIGFKYKEKNSVIALEQLGTVVKAQLVKNVGKLDEVTAKTISDRLSEMFSY